jgi:hypothetical protein
MNTAISHASSRHAINKKAAEAKDSRAVKRSKGPSVMLNYLALVLKRRRGWGMAKPLKFAFLQRL